MNANITLESNDLMTPESFRGWIKKGLPHLYLQKEVPVKHLLIYLNYIKDTVLQNKNLDSKFWGDLIRQLESNLQSLERSENEL